MGESQHYIPQFLLRHFSNDGETGRISLYDLNKDIVYENVPIRSVCCKKNLYGSGQEIENLLAIIEHKASICINDILGADTIVESRFILYLRWLIILQIMRTPSAISNFYKSVAKIYKLYSEGKERQGTAFTNNSGLDQAYIFTLMEAVGSYKYTRDLRVGLLVNKSNEQFVIGESPVCIVNPLLCMQKWNSARKGLALRGVIIYMPISPTRAIVLYDTGTYRLKDFPDKSVISGDDVTCLNMLEFAETSTKIFYSGNANYSAFTSYSAITKDYRESAKHIGRRYRTKARKGFLLSISQVAYPFSINLSCLTCRASALSRPLINPIDIIRDDVKQIASQDFQERAGMPLLYSEQYEDMGFNLEDEI